jgi:hypothetical protein
MVSYEAVRVELAARLTLPSVKRDIAHLCRDVTPPSSAKKGDSEPNTEAASSSLPVAAPIIDQQQPLVYDAASSAWPLLPAPAAAAAAAGGSGGAVPIDISTLAPQAGSSAGGWGLAENAEFGILRCVQNFGFGIPRPKGRRQRASRDSGRVDVKGCAEGQTKGFMLQAAL